ncbi:UV radiation resistance protein and autophagy-related subunit 14-domain-containing protein [Naematelia encephala]|uniref:Autophagy-related protein 14 n=1 Tax=Naematelia encephala TaxID=71784 RepID=A0A1Y2AYM9_9TREE|nr:UV radiation resistance protein and autophagy-related subunit 14-domain-containing protein [Naematelia encephala]
MSYCPACQYTKSALYCASCIREGVAKHHQLSNDLRAQGAASSQRARSLIEQPRGIDSWRQLRAQVANAEQRCARLRRAIAKIPDATAPNSRYVAQSSSVENAFLRIRHQQDEVSRRLVHARCVLVREALAVFGVQRDAIAGLPLPPPQMFRLYPATHINAAVLHTLHLLSLLTRYLSIALPFSPSFSTATHVGRPSLRANVPFVTSTKFRDKNVLWMSTRKKNKYFFTSFALLAFSVSYLAWSQGVDGIGVALDEETTIASTQILALMIALAESPRLGIQSHEPGTKLLPHLGFGMDVNLVVDAVLAGEVWEDTEGWDLVEAPRDAY